MSKAGENNRKKIWSGKSVPGLEKAESEFDAFCILKEADGFDVAVNDRQKYFRAFYEEFNRFFENITSKCSVPVKSLFEVGCGSGENLFMFKNRLKDSVLGGLDYSKNLLDNAEKIVGGGDFIHDNAENLPVVPQYDLVMSESVFEYFPSQEYSEKVLRRMIEKSRVATCILGLYDAKKEQVMMDYRRSTIPDYDERYKGLPKRFYHKEMFSNIAREYGKTASFSYPDNPEYWNAEYQFNTIII